MANKKDEKMNARKASMGILSNEAFSTLAGAGFARGSGEYGPKIDQNLYPTAYHTALKAIEEDDDTISKEISTRAIYSLMSSYTKDNAGSFTGSELYENITNSYLAHATNITIGDVYNLIEGKISDERLEPYVEKYISELIESENEDEQKIAQIALGELKSYLKDRSSMSTLENIVQSHSKTLEGGMKKILGFEDEKKE